MNAGVMRVPRFYLYVGCADPECEGDHSHQTGWDSMGAASDSLEEMRASILEIPEHLWWHVVDIITQSVIMRSSYKEAARH